MWRCLQVQPQSSTICSEANWLFLFPEQPENDRDCGADQQHGGDGEEKFEARPIENDVSSEGRIVAREITTQISLATLHALAHGLHALLECESES